MSDSYISRELRSRVSSQAKHRCGYCLTSENIVGTPMEIDHLIPEILGGSGDEENLWLACSLCNSHKSDRIAAVDPVTQETVRFFDPRQENWNEHFAWSAAADLVLGLTPRGRATVLALKINRPSLVHARRAWVSVGWHPPKD